MNHFDLLSRLLTVGRKQVLLADIHHCRIASPYRRHSASITTLCIAHSSYFIIPLDIPSFGLIFLAYFITTDLRNCLESQRVRPSLALTPGPVHHLGSELLPLLKRLVCQHISHFIVALNQIATQASRLSFMYLFSIRSWISFLSPILPASLRPPLTLQLLKDSTMALFLAVICLSWLTITTGFVLKSNIQTASDDPTTISGASTSSGLSHLTAHRSAITEPSITDTSEDFPLEYLYGGPSFRATLDQSFVGIPNHQVTSENKVDITRSEYNVS